MKIKTTLHIYHTQYTWMEKPEYQVFSFEAPNDEHRTFMATREVEIEVPDDFDPREQQIQVLLDKKQKAMAEYQKTMTQIDGAISKLQAISYTA